MLLERNGCENMNIKVKKLTNTAKLPEKNNFEDAGFDLFTDRTVILKPGDKLIIGTGIALDIPTGFEGEIRPRSGNALRTDIKIHQGTIDAHYQGEVGLIVSHAVREPQKDPDKYDIKDINTKTKDVVSYLIPKGTKLAQMVINPVPKVTLEEVEELPNLKETQRGSKGFGSSGVK